MHIKKIVSRHRRDFIANYECEHLIDDYDELPDADIPF